MEEKEANSDQEEYQASNCGLVNAVPRMLFVHILKPQQ